MKRILITTASICGLSACAQYTAPLPFPDPDIYEHAGQSVAIDSGHLWSGSHYDKGVPGDYEGKVLVYQRKNGEWESMTSLSASDATADYGFGWDVAIDGARAVVGSWNYDSPLVGFDGAAYVFEFSGEDWVETAILDDSPYFVDIAFGYSVSTSGNRIAVGSPFPLNSDPGEGSVYVFRHDQASNSWVEEARLQPSDGNESDQFGYDVAIEGDYLIVGAPGDDDLGEESGSAYVFERVGGQWVESAKLTAFDGDDGHRFGQSVDFSDDTLVSGAPNADGRTQNAGAAYVFERLVTVPGLVPEGQSIGSDWLPDFKATAFDGTDGANFGVSVGIDGQAFIVGASKHLGSPSYPNERGAAYVYHPRFNGFGWVLSVQPIPEEGNLTEYYGGSVGISEGCAVIGASWFHINAGDPFGATHATCHLPGISEDAPELEMDIVCCRPSQNANTPMGYTVSLSTDLDRPTVARYRVQLTGPDKRAQVLLEREIDYVPGQATFRDQGVLPLDERSRDGLYTFSVYLTDETGQTHIEHERFWFQGGR